MKVSEIMHKNPVCVTVHESLSNIAKEMKKGDFGVVVVKEGEKVLGMITDRDIVVRAIANGSDIKEIHAEDIMSKNVISCDLNDSIEKAASKMQAEKIRRLIVVDDKKQMVGILSLGDVAVSEKGNESGFVFKTLEKISEPH